LEGFLYYDETLYAANELIGEGEIDMDWEDCGDSEWFWDDCVAMWWRYPTECDGEVVQDGWQYWDDEFEFEFFISSGEYYDYWCTSW
jgi:hypothetical protein